MRLVPAACDVVNNYDKGDYEWVLYLDARTASQAALELEESTADLVLHRRSALVVVNRGSAMCASRSGTAAEHSSTRLSSGGGGGGGDGVTVGTGWGTSASAEDGATRGSVSVSPCKRHVG